MPSGLLEKRRDSAVSTAFRLGQRLTSCAALLQSKRHPGEHLYMLGLWPVTESADLDEGGAGRVSAVCRSPVGNGGLWADHIGAH